MQMTSFQPRVSTLLEKLANNAERRAPAPAPARLIYSQIIPCQSLHYLFVARKPPSPFQVLVSLVSCMRNWMQKILYTSQFGIAEGVVT